MGCAGGEDFKAHLIPRELLQQIAELEAELSLLYSSFRPKINGRPFSENEIRQCLRRKPMLR